MIKLKDLLNEGISVAGERSVGKFTIVILTDGGKMRSAILSKKNAKKYNRNDKDVLKNLWNLADKYKGQEIKESVNEAKKKQLTDADIKVGDAYKNRSARGFEVSIVYGKAHYGGWQTVDYQFEPQYGASGFMGVGSGPPESVDGWGKDKKIKITSKMKKAMIKTLQDAMKSKYKNSEEVDTLVRNGLRLSNVLSWVKARL